MTNIFKQMDNVFNEFDVYTKNLFNTHENYIPIFNSDLKYPVDVYINEDKSLNIEISLPGISKDEVSLDVNNDILKVTYLKENTNEESSKTYLYKKIAKRSCNFAWKISSKYNLNDIGATMKDGILLVNIPLSKEEEIKNKKIEIK